MTKVGVISFSARTRVLRRRSFGALVVVMASVLLLMPRDAMASTGCTAINGGSFNMSAGYVDVTASQGGFAIGDQLTMVYNAYNGGDHFRLSPASGGADLDNFNPSMNTNTRVHTLTASQLSLVLTIRAGGYAGVSTTASCVAAAVAPTVASISPSTGAAAGGVSVTITGSDFTGTTGVTIGGVAATGVTVVSNTSITATTPAHAAGAVDVVVTNASGSGTGSGLYTYVAAPTVTSIAPAAGRVAGGTTVTITGTAFTGATAVTIGGVAATGVTVVNATSISAVTGAHAAGAVNVVVTTPAGSGTGAGLFTYIAAPTATSIGPATGPIAGGTTVTIRGAALTGASSVTIGGVAASSIVVVDATTITAVTPAHAAGAVDVVVTTPWGTFTGTGFFTYAAVPTVTSITPAAGTVAGGTAVTITGTAFTGATLVTIGGVVATGVAVVNATTVTATTAAHAAGAVDVVVTTPGGTATGTGLFTYVTGPTVTAISPASGPIAGGTAVTITGTDLTDATAVTIGGIAATGIAVVNATTITATTAAHAAGAADVVVTTPGGATTGTGLFSYVTAPTITAISPTSGSIAGGTRVTISGSSLAGATTVMIGGVAATSIAVVNATTVTATTAAHAAGAVDIVVTTPGGTATDSGLFTYVTGPTVSASSPASGPIAGGTAVTITGTDLTGATAVTIGGAAATGIAVVNATTITATTASHAAGAVDVLVTTPGGIATGTGLFTYVTAPAVTAIGPANGSIAGGTIVTITGTGLTGATAVTIGGVAATGLAVVNATTVTVTTAAAHAAGAVDVVVTTPAGTGTGVRLYTYVAGPTITSISPPSGSVEGGMALSITGTGLTGATAVTIGGVAITGLTVVNATSITGTTAPHAVGVVNVAVTTPSGTATGRDLFTYTATLTLASTASAVAQVGQPYSQANVASGGTLGYTYTVSAGNLPDGTGLAASTGVVSGTPTTSGAFSYTVMVTDHGATPLTASQVVAGTIAPIVSATALTSSVNPSTMGQPVTLTATITPGSATGTVAFKDDATTLCGAVPLAGGAATCRTTLAAPGAHAITAIYSGSSVLGASTSAVLLQTVNDQRIKAVETIGKFISRRNDLIVANAPDADRQIDRLIGAGANPPASVRAVGSTGGPMQFDVATSLSRVRRDGANAAQGQGVAPTRATLPFDIWIDGKYGSFGDTHAGNDLEGHFGLVSLGADYLLSPTLVVGGMVQLDSMRQRSKSQVSEASGRGWMAGPYATFRVAGHLFWQARVAVGGSSNRASPFQTYTDQFGTHRRLISSALTGSWSAGPWVLRPSVSVAYIADVAGSYTDTFNMVVPEVTSRLGQVRVGPQVSYRYQFRPDVVLEPRVGLQMIANFGGVTTAGGFGQIDGQDVGSAGARGRVEFGVRASRSRGIGLELSGSYDGIGAGDYPAFAGQVLVRVPLK